MSIKLELCPFCGSGTISVADPKSNPGHESWAHCINCLASTCLCNTREEAIKAWNRRAFEKGGLVDELVGALEVSVGEMRTWESLDECDCPPEGHHCGISRLRQSIYFAGEALVRAKGDAKKGVE